MFDGLLSEYHLPSSEIEERPVFRLNRILKDANDQLLGEGECERLDLMKCVFKVIILQKQKINEKLN